MKTDNAMDAKRDYVLDMIIKNLEDVNSSLDKLSKYTTDEVGYIKIELIRLTEDIKQMKSHPCPKSPELIREIISTERLKLRSAQPKKFMEIVGWVVAVSVGFLTIYFAI